MNDHDVIDEVDDWPEYLIGQQQRHRFLTNSRKLKTTRRRFHNAFPGMAKIKHTSFSFSITCQIRWFLGVADGCNH